MEAYDRTNSAKLADGKLLTVDNAIDVTTGTVKLRAQFENADGLLFPNQFVNIQLLQEVLQNQVIMPNSAVRRGAPNGVVSTFVYVVNPDRTVSVRPVTLGVVDGERVAVTQGLAAGEVVVTEGGDRLRDGAEVQLPGAAGTRGRHAPVRQALSPAARGPAVRSPAPRARPLRTVGTVPNASAMIAGRGHARCRMNPSRIFILRPVATTLLMVAILIVGAIAYLQLPLSALPEVAYPTIQVQTFYPGASPEVITSAITAPLEKQFGQMPGLSQMSSTSSAGASVITLQFSLALAIDVAEQQVQAAISGAQNLLPQDLPAPPIYAKVNPADAPVLTLGLTSKVMPLTEVEDLADTRIAQKISQIKGVGVVSISGGQRPAVRVVANPRAMAAYGLNLDDLRTTINNANQNGPKGTLDGPSIGLHGQYQRSDPQRGGLRQRRGRLQERRTGPAQGCGRLGLGRGERQARRLDEPGPGADPQRAAPAGRQRRRRRQPHPRSLALAAGRAAGGSRPRHPHRSHHDHQSLGRRRRIRTGARRRAGRAGDLPVPAQCSGHHHSQPFRAAVADRHLRGDVPGELQPQ